MENLNNNYFRHLKETIKKNIRHSSGFKLLLFYFIWGAIFDIAVYFYTNHFVSAQQFSNLSNGGNYFSFIIIGYAFSDIFVTTIMTASTTINQERLLGTFETIILSPFSLIFILISEAFLEIAKSLVRVSIIIIIGLFLGVSTGTLAQFFQASFSVLISIVIFFSISLIFGGFALLDRRFLHLGSLYISISTVLSGALFPITLLPEKLQNIVVYFPFPYCMKLIRSIANGNTSIIETILFPLGISLIFLSVSVFIFRKLETFARKKALILRY